MIEEESIFKDKINRHVKSAYEKLVFKCPYDDQCSFKGSL